MKVLQKKIKNVNDCKDCIHEIDCNDKYRLSDMYRDFNCFRFEKLEVHRITSYQIVQRVLEKLSLEEINAFCDLSFEDFSWKNISVTEETRKYAIERLLEKISR